MGSEVCIIIWQKNTYFLGKSIKSVFETSKQLSDICKEVSNTVFIIHLKNKFFHILFCRDNGPHNVIYNYLYNYKDVLNTDFIIYPRSKFL